MKLFKKRYYVEPVRMFWSSSCSTGDRIINKKGSYIVYFVKKRNLFGDDSIIDRFKNVDAALDKFYELTEK